MARAAFVCLEGGMAWVVMALDERDRVRYWSVDQELVLEREAAKPFTDRAEAVAVGRLVLLAGRFRVFLPEIRLSAAQDDP